jgi:hypothetical protein
MRKELHVGCALDKIIPIYQHPRSRRHLVFGVLFICILVGRVDADPIIRHPEIPIPVFLGILILYFASRVLDSGKSLLAIVILMIVVPANYKYRMLCVELVVRCRCLGAERSFHSVRFEADKLVDVTKNGVPVGYALLPAVDVSDHWSNVMELERWR